MTGGKVFEKAGVNLSVVYGTMPQEVILSPAVGLASDSCIVSKR